MSLSHEFAGAGAMLARLVQLGARSGLSAEATLLHVLDGAPLPEQLAAPASVADIVDRMRAADPVAAPTEIAGATDGAARTDIDLGHPIVQFLRNDEVTLGAVLTIDEALQPTEKREKIANLYGSTALRNGPIAELTGSTAGSVSFFLNEFRRAGDPRIIRGDRLRGINLPGTEIPAEAPMAVDGVGVGGATALPSQSDDILPAGFSEEGRRADLGPDVSPEGAEEECAERDAGSSDPGGDVAAFPAPPAVQEDAPEKGDASSQQVQLDVAPAVDTAVRPAGPGLDQPDDHIGDVTNMVAADEMVGGDPVAAAPCHAEETGDEGVDSESTLTGGESAAEPAGASPPSPAGSSPPISKKPTASDEVVRLWRDTLLLQSGIATEIGKSLSFVGAIISQKRKKKDPGILAGDAARQAAAAAPADAAPSPADPAPESELLDRDPATVLAIEGDMIFGPAGRLKGFPLINAVLMALARGDLLDAAVVAKKCAVRSGDAVLAQLAHWKGDLATIGIEVVRVGPTGVRLRRLA